MSTEHPRIRSFKNLEGFEELARTIRLTVIDSSLGRTSLEPGQTLHLSSTELPRVGLQIDLSWTDESIADAIDSSHLPADAISTVVIGEDRFLKERTILRDPASPSALLPAVKLTTVNGERDRSLLNPISGFEICVAFYLNRALEDRIAFRPHRKGTILAEAAFAVRGQRDAGGLDPEPLTEKIRKDNDLPKGTLLFVDCDSDVLTAEDLSAVHLYVHEELLKRLAQAPGIERTTVLQQLAIDAWTQLVYVMSEEIEPDFTWNGTDGALLRSLQRLLQTVGKKVTSEELVELIREKPRRLCALLSGCGEHAGRLLKKFEETEEAEAS